MLVSVNEETHQGLSRAREALRGVFETQHNFEVDHFTGLKIRIVCRGSNPAVGQHGPRFHLDVVLHAKVLPQTKDLGNG